MSAAPWLLAGAALLAAASSDAAGPSTAAAQAAARFRALTVAPADDAGTQRWVVWQEGTGATHSAHLALWSAGKLSAPVAWPDGYAPTLKTLPAWRYHDQPVAAVQIQFGAAAAEVALYGVGAGGRAVRLDDRMAAAVDWRADASGRSLLVTSDATSDGLVPTCMAWNETTAKLAATPCPTG